MKKLGLAAATVFLVGIILAALSINGNDRTVVDSYSRLNKDGLHYYFVVCTGKNRRSVEVTEAAYNSHGYGDMFDPSWVKNVGH